jgi:hypothetical protein
MRAATAKTEAAAEEVAVRTTMVADETPLALGTFVDGQPGRLPGEVGVGAEKDLVAAAAPSSVAAGAGAVAGACGWDL